jgi:hypothetical protein
MRHAEGEEHLQDPDLRAFMAHLLIRVARGLCLSASRAHDKPRVDEGQFSFAYAPMTDTMGRQARGLGEPGI